MSDTVTVPAGFVDRFNAWIDRLVDSNEAPPPAPEPTPAADIAEYEALQSQVAKYEADIAERDARIATMEAETARAARVAHFAAELSEAAPVADDSELHTLLAGLDDETAAPIVTRFKALSAQIKESALTGALGGNGKAGEQTPTAAIDAYRAEHPDATYTQAYEAVKAAQPDLFAGA